MFGTRTMRGATAAAMLPSALLVALLVGAPFAGTTTAPLIADRPAAASAPANGAAGGTAAGSTATTGTATSSVPGTAPAAELDANVFNVEISRSATTVLIGAWAVLAAVGFIVLTAVARRSDADA